MCNKIDNTLDIAVKPHIQWPSIFYNANFVGIHVYYQSRTVEVIISSLNQPSKYELRSESSDPVSGLINHYSMINEIIGAVVANLMSASKFMGLIPFDSSSKCLCVEHECFPVFE